MLYDIDTIVYLVIHYIQAQKHWVTQTDSHNVQQALTKLKELKKQMQM